MGRYRYMEHTGEVGVEAWGDSLADAFAAAAEGMFAVMADLDTVRDGEAIEVEVQAADMETLLVEWLNELLFRSEVDNLLLKRCEILEIDDGHVKARCYGERPDQDRHRLGGGVKAATYHLVRVESHRPYRVRVILDV
ncbi:MAG: archease [Chloroflexi bacterium]|nr:archease [Chloroflexota bacterium]